MIKTRVLRMPHPDRLMTENDTANNLSLELKLNLSVKMNKLLVLNIVSLSLELSEVYFQFADHHK